jgi:glycosyltransferase involved in cell wall biosynthesis
MGSTRRCSSPCLGRWRARLGIPSDKPVVLFGAQSMMDPSKGGVLREALRCFERSCTLLVFGKGQFLIEQASHITVHQLGSFTDDLTLASVYSVADVFVCPSREDNLPNTVARSARMWNTMCGICRQWITGYDSAPEERLVGEAL